MMRLLDDGLRDVRYAARVLGRSPGFAAVAVLSLALGIGANTAIFSVIDALMLRPLPVDRPSELVSFVRNIQGVATVDAWPYPTFETFRGLGVFSAVTASASVPRANLRIAGRDGDVAGHVVVGLVSGSYFETLGVRPAAGRTLSAEDDREPGGGPVAVVSDAFWRREFAGTPASAVLGQTFTLNATTYTIVGIGPPGFSGESVGDPTDLWVPMTMQAQVMPENPGLLTNPGSSFVIVIGRLKPGLTPQAAEAAARAIFKPSAASWQASQRLEVIPAGRGFSRGREFLEQPLTLLMAVVGLVLLIACANIATLLLARSAARRKELAVRLAIGAGRWRLARQLLAESLLITVLAGAVGLLLGVVGTHVLTALQSSGRLQINLDVALDRRMLGITSLFSLISGALFGLAPAWSATRFSLTPALTGAVTSGARGIARFRAGKVLVVAQVAVTLVLAIGAGLLVRTLRNLETQDVGFDRAHVWLFWMEPREVQRQKDALAPLFAAAEDRVPALHGVVSAAVSSNGILSGFVGLRAVSVPGRISAPDEDVNAQWDLIGPHFFETLGMRIVSGRDFRPSDTANSAPVAIVNEAMARHFFGDASPIGRRFGFGRDLSQMIEVVGVAHNSKYFSARDDNVPMVYLPYRQDVAHLYRMCVIVRTTSDDAPVVAGVRDALRRLDPVVPLGRVTSTAEQLDSTLSEERLTAWFAGSFGALAVMLACIGLYGVMAYTVARRTREIGIRMALGATRGRVLRTVLFETGALAGLGIAIGVPATIAGARWMGTLLFGVTPTDPVTIAGASALLLGVAALAGYLPARRASNVDPIVALRTE